MKEDPYRLPRHVVPKHYRLRLEPDLERAAFDGSEIVEVEVTEPTDRVVLNAIELDIHSARMIGSDGRSIDAEVSYDEERQRAILSLAEKLPAGSAQIHCRFSGILNDQLRGFYRSTFTDQAGESQVIATTQFEATDARRAFPCWDEPDFKASFGVTLVVSDNFLAVSNGAELRRSTLEDGRVEVTFADTIVMSTYLVAFVVGPFEATEPVIVNGVPLRVIAPKGKRHLADFALECGRFCLDYLAGYYDIPYPGDKLDMVAIPDFAFGAMENLGCVTYRESALLLDEEVATTAEKMRVLDVIGHELAHMWFGDLVTMKWWNGIWLNEAFATFMEMKATDAFRPEWERWLEFAAAERPWAFKVDELSETRPVEFEVRSPEEAEGMFDAITYGKGSAVLRMLEQYVGEEPFRRGVGEYLRTHAYANTETEDLWASLDASSDSPVSEILNTWVHQGGYPQITIRADDDGLEIGQQRFLLIPDNQDTSLWKVPIRLRGVSDGRPFRTNTLLEGPGQRVALPGTLDWVIANAGGHGFYRSRYSRPLLTALLGQLGDLTPVERFILADDTWSFVEAGQVDVADFLVLAQAYREERSQAVWGTLLAATGAIGHHLVIDQVRPGYEGWVAELLEPLADELGWIPAAGETDLERRLRGRVIGSLGRLANRSAVVEQARSTYQQHLDDPTSVDPEVVQAVIAVCAAHGDAETYESFLDKYQTAPNPQDSMTYLRAMASFDSQKSTDRTLGLITDRTVRNQDASWVLAQLLANRKTGPYAWKQITEKWDDLLEIVPPMTRSRIADGFPALSDPDVAAEVLTFLHENPLDHAKQAVKQKLERLKVLVRLRGSQTEAATRLFRGKSD
ncbi:MAG: M1 family peptidase [Acidimicrobiia bacterium]|nr:M1 family peptidase [Acidimicrobiia bacterium]